MYGLKAKESQRQYPKRLQVFLDFLNIQADTLEEKINKLFHMMKARDRDWLENQLMQYFMFHNERADKGEISAASIKNYYIPIKLFCEMNGILVNWKLISKGIKRGDKNSHDRPPTREEIKQLLEYPDRRIKPIVLVMLSSGIRVSSWNYLKWKHVTPLKKNEKIVAAKLDVFNTKTKKMYFTFITLEAFDAVKEWMEFRESFGENITGESWIMRDLWRIKSQNFGNFLGLASEPKQFTSEGIRTMINDAWQIQGVRSELKEGEKRHEFKSLHGFRKFFETQCQKVMKSIHVSMLMSHDTGIVQHYYRPKEEELLEEYLKTSDLLTINEENRLSKKVLELQEKNKDNKYIIEGKLIEKDKEIAFLREKDLVKEEAIANLSDQLVTLTKKLQNIENRL